MPSLPDVGPVEHVRDEDVLHPVVRLAPGVVHRRARPGHDERVAGVPREQPVPLDQLHVAGVDALRGRLLEEDHRPLAVLAEGVGVDEGEGRDRDDDADLEAALGPQRVRLPPGDREQGLAALRQDPFQLDVDRGIAEARRELERMDAPRVDDAVDVYKQLINSW